MQAAPDTSAQPQQLFTIRPARADDLADINAAVERAVDGWTLSERLRRLVRPLCRYDAVDLGVMRVLVAVSGAGLPALAGVAALEVDPARSAPRSRVVWSLHGLYVDPAHQRRGIGSELLRRGIGLAAASGASALELRAQRGSQGFFEARGFCLLAPPVGRDDYPLRYHRRLEAGREGSH